MKTVNAVQSCFFELCITNNLTINALINKVRPPPST